jgi:hypothetical protein
VAKGKVAAHKKSKDPQLEKLLTLPGVREARNNNGDGWASGVKYAMQSRKRGKNWGLYILSGKRPQPACQHPDCVQLAQPAPGKGATHCRQHGGGPRCKGSDPKNEPHQDCPALPYPTSVVWPGGKADHYKGRCVSCFIRTDPNHPLSKAASKYQMARQHKVIEVLGRAFPGYKWSIDRAFCVGVKRRPDAKVRTADRILIVEIDEDSHKAYKCPDERERELEMRNRADGAEICMIRFNPDGYECPRTGKRVPSCFKFCAPPRNYDDIPEAQRSPKWGTTTLDPKQSAEWDARCNALCAWVSCLIDPNDPAYMPKIPRPQTDRYIWTVELYYDHVVPMDPKAAARLAAIKRAAKKRKRAREMAEAKRARENASCSVES